MPWVRMHGIKDYWDMVRILDDYPNIKQTFNFAPSLLEQIREYLENGITDVAYNLSLKNPDSFTGDDKILALKTFFLANTERMVKRYPRYAELMNKRGVIHNDGDFAVSSSRFTPQDFRDLQVWWNLAWIGEYSRFDPPFKFYLEKQRDFTEADKSNLLKSQIDILRRIVPHHVMAAERGQIEISTSPFYHPILPLLCDTDIAREASGDTTLPTIRFKHPEDAGDQIKSALDFCEHVFGFRPAGMWPSEGSISDETLALMSRNKVKWTATDELVLKKSLICEGRKIRDSFTEKYFAYRLGTDRSNAKIFFRDHTLSDLIGFVYSRWSPDDAANDFILRLLKIRDTIKGESGEKGLASAVVPIILDGENAWEFYQSDGKDFLRTLYYRLTNEPRLRTVLPSEIKTSPENSLRHIVPGSWINGDFKIWIGHPEDNRAWDLLSKARATLEKDSMNKSSASTAAAYREIKIAEGSDWCWWYGDEHKSPQSTEFDQLFRHHLKQVYVLLGLNPPVELDEPIKRKPGVFYRQPKRMVTPKFDKPDRDEQWKDAGFMEQTESVGAMQRVGARVRRVCFGNDSSNIYIRIDTSVKISSESIQIRLNSNPEIVFEVGSDFAFRVPNPDGDLEFAGRCLIDDTLQLAISRRMLRTAEEASLTVAIIEDNKMVDLFPAQGTAKFAVVQ